MATRLVIVRNGCLLRGKAQIRRLIFLACLFLETATTGLINRFECSRVKSFNIGKRMWGTEKVEMVILLANHLRGDKFGKSLKLPNEYIKKQRVRIDSLQQRREGIVGPIITITEGELGRIG